MKIYQIYLPYLLYYIYFKITLPIYTLNKFDIYNIV